MSNNINLNDITSQIQEYVRVIKQRKAHTGSPSQFSAQNDFTFLNNDVRSNIHPLNGDNKFRIQKWSEDQNKAPLSKYASEAYAHLNEKDDKHKVVIDLMHKNNRNYDVKA